MRNSLSGSCSGPGARFKTSLSVRRLRSLQTVRNPPEKRGGPACCVDTDFILDGLQEPSRLVPYLVVPIIRSNERACLLWRRNDDSAIACNAGHILSRVLGVRHAQRVWSWAAASGLRVSCTRTNSSRKTANAGS